MPERQCNSNARAGQAEANKKYVPFVRLQPSPSSCRSSRDTWGHFLSLTYRMAANCLVLFLFLAGSHRQPLSGANRDEDFVTPQPRSLRNQQCAKKRPPPKKAIITFSSDEENSSEDGMALYMYALKVKKEKDYRFSPGVFL